MEHLTHHKTNHTMTMKTLAFLLLSSTVALSSSAKTNPVVLSDERVRYAVEYDTIRAGLLGKTGDEMGDVEALQAIVVHFSRAFKRTESRLQKLESDIAAIKKRVDAAEINIADSEKRITEAEKRLKTQDEDLTKIFNWATDIDDELHNSVRVGGSINSRLDSLDKQVNSLDKQLNHWWGGLSSRVSGMERTLDSHDGMIRNILNALNRR
jgi:chromosome segregation ATPase